MPKVKQVVAQKDYPEHGIVKGQKHHYWVLKTGPYTSRTYRQVAPPRIEQVTTSSYRIAMAGIEEAASGVGDRDALQSLIDMVEELASEQREKFDNMPEGLQHGDTGQTLEQQADALDAARDELEIIMSEWEAAEEDHDSLRRGFEEYEVALGEWDEASGEPEPEEVEDPGEWDDSEFTGRVSDVSFE